MIHTAVQLCRQLFLVLLVWRYKPREITLMCSRTRHTAQEMQQQRGRSGERGGGIGKKMKPSHWPPKITPRTNKSQPRTKNREPRTKQEPTTTKQAAKWPSDTAVCCWVPQPLVLTFWFAAQPPLKMRIVNCPPLARRALRVLNGANLGIAGGRGAPLLTPHHGAMRNATSVALSQLVSQGHQPRSPPPMTNRANNCVWSNLVPRSARDCTVGRRRMLTPFEAPVCRKRQPSWRSLSTRASDPGSPTASSTASSASSSAGGEGDVDDNGKAGDDDNGSCWKCSLTVAEREFFCECGAVQPLDGRLDYFEMLGSPPSVFLDLKAVERQFKNLQRAFHPDLFASKCKDEQAISAANSTTANKAYQTLVRTMPRVKYLMRTRGSRALEEEGAEDKTPVPPDFLMQIMETRESLEQCESTDEAEKILTEATVAIDDCLGSMDKVLKAGGDKDELDDAAVRLRYLHRIQEEARRVMHRLEDERSRPSTG